MNLDQVVNAISQLLELPICLIQATIRLEKQVEKAGFLENIGVVASDDGNIDWNTQMISFLNTFIPPKCP